MFVLESVVRMTQTLPHNNALYNANKLGRSRTLSLFKAFKSDISIVEH